jgi:cytochrome c556
MLPAVVLLAIVAAGGMGAAQEKPPGVQEKPYPIFTVDHFLSAMKTVGQAYGAVNISLSKQEIEDSKAYLAISRDRLATTITFWRDRKKDDAIKILRETLAKMDELDVALSAEKLDTAAASAISKQIGASCEACHAVYREQDPSTRAFRIKNVSAQ